MLAFARKAVRGALHANIAIPLCAASLVPLRKKDGGVRPIAVGDVLKRVIGKFLLKDGDVRHEVAALGPRQCGVGVPFAAEHVGMTVQAMARRGGRWGILQVDVSNAFNTIDRSAMLRGAQRLAPHVEPWLHWCYRQAVPLYSQGHKSARA